jgi:hypothetical protein
MLSAASSVTDCLNYCWVRTYFEVCIKSFALITYLLLLVAIGKQSSSFRAAGEFEAMATVPYATQGFVYLNYFFGSTGTPDLTCATESFISMYSVNYCYQTETFAMKLQLTEGTLSTRENPLHAS